MNTATSVVQFDRYGPPEVLHVVHVDPADVPRPGPGQIAVAVHAAGVQPFDCATRRGDFAQWNPLTLPSGLGNEIAGVVVEVGPDTTWSVGDEVIAFLDLAGYASRVVVPADHAVAKPPAMTWAQAGGLAVSGQTASTALDALDLHEGDRLLIHAGAGGVGSMAVQLAVHRGVEVIATASTANHDYVRALSATPVAYGPGLAERVRSCTPHGITAALDCIGGDALEVSLDLLGTPARIVTIADYARHQALGIRRVGTDRSRARLSRLTHAVDRGELHVQVSHTYSLHNVPAAHRHVETGHGRGKTVLLPHATTNTQNASATDNPTNGQSR